jgi:hypothetical protein
MRVHWTIDPEDGRRVKALVDAQHNSPSVQDRIRRNVGRQDLILSREVVWAEMVGCLVSTQQRWEKAEQFLHLDPFPLSYDVCRHSDNVRDVAERALRDGGRLRRWRRIAAEMQANLDKLESGLWADMLGALEGLRLPADPARERAVADFIDARFVGFGPKQVRNLTQGLGLTRYEIPMDSRIVRWLTQFGHPAPLSATLLADRSYYHFILDSVQFLCAQCEVYPCVLDAAVFVSMERK